MPDRTAPPPVCDYEGSDYQTSFWERGGRGYEDQAEAFALRKLMPPSGRLLLEVGAGAGRNTPRYAGFEQVVLLDYSRTQLQQAQSRLGRSRRYIYIAADVYALPFVENLFDAATMIRTLHHMADAPAALRQVHRVLLPGAAFILEYANKRNLKAILRYFLRCQDWNPFTPEPFEFAPLNFDFHPQTVHTWLREIGFEIQAIRTVSHFRLGILKRLFPSRLLAALDAVFQPTGRWWQLTPSVFVGCRRSGDSTAANPPEDVATWFRCVVCGHAPLSSKPNSLMCPACRHTYAFEDGIYDLRPPR